MVWQVRERYPCATTSPALGRAFCTAELRDALGDQPPAPRIIGVAELIVSELLTNAVNAACHTTELTLTGDERRLRIEVADDGVGVPALHQPDAKDEHGRGLLIVAALAQKWGFGASDLGKQVWAELAIV